MLLLLDVTTELGGGVLGSTQEKEVFGPWFVHAFDRPRHIVVTPFSNTQLTSGSI
jgi:hypothetical protein